MKLGEKAFKTEGTVIFKTLKLMIPGSKNEIINLSYEVLAVIQTSS